MNKKIKLSILSGLLAATSLSIVMPIVSCSTASETPEPPEPPKPPEPPLSNFNVKVEKNLDVGALANLGAAIYSATSGNVLSDNNQIINSDLFAKMVSANDVINPLNGYNGTRVINTIGSNATAFDLIISFLEIGDSIKITNTSSENVTLKRAIESFNITGSNAWEMPMWSDQASGAGDLLFNIEIKLKEEFKIVDDASRNNLQINNLKVGTQGKTIFEIMDKSSTADLGKLGTDFREGNKIGGTFEDGITLEQIANNIALSPTTGNSNHWMANLLKKIFDFKFAGLSIYEWNKANKWANREGGFVLDMVRSVPTNTVLETPVMLEYAIGFAGDLGNPEHIYARHIWERTNLRELYPDFESEGDKSVLKTITFQIGILN